MIFNFLAIVILLAMSAMLSGMETAITASTLNKIKLAKLRGIKNSDKALELFQIKGKVISVLLITDNVLSTIATALSTSTAIQLCGQEMGLIASSVITPILIIAFVDILPKIVAVVKAESILISASPLFQFLLIVFSPLSNTLDKITNKVRKYIKPNPLYELHQGEHYTESPLDEDSTNFSTQTLNVGKTFVTEIMTNLDALQNINYELETTKFLEAALSIPYSKIPVWQGNKLNMIGTLQVPLLLKLLTKGQSNDLQFLKKIIDDSITPMRTIEKNTPITHQLIHFVKHQYGFAMIINEDSRYMGFLTLNDIVSSIASYSDS
jgi:Mg2+/Co2+ transporter CorB